MPDTKRDPFSPVERPSVESDVRVISEPPRKQIGSYQLIVKIGEGGMGTVWLTKLLGPVGVNKLAVVKELRADLANSPEFVEMFLNEARLAARLTHPNVVHTYGANEDKGRLFIAMEYLDGQPWSQVRHALWSNRSLPLAMHIKVLADTLAGLHYAHELRDYQGKALEVVHRDMSPQNTFVTYDGQVKLVDFGVARMATAQTKGASLFVGKLAYSSPEQLTGGAIDRRADIFAVGVMLWEALAGRRLMEDQEQRTQAARRRAFEPAPRIRDVVPSVPRLLETICERALALDPADRYATAAEFRAALLDYLAETSQVVDSAQIGQLVADAFRDQRRRINSLIELSLHDSMPPPPVEVMEPPRSPSPGDYTVRADLSELASVSKLGDEQQMVEATNSLSIRLDDRRRKRAIIAGAALVALLFVGFAIAKMGGSSPEPGVKVIQLRSNNSAPSPTAPPPARSIGEVAMQAVPTEVSLTISATPQHATIFLDGTPLPRNPYVSKVRSDGEMHLIRVSAPGAQPQERVVAFDRDKELTFTLAVHGANAAARGRSPGTQAAGAPRTPESRARAAAPGERAGAARDQPQDADYDTHISTDRAPRAIYEEDPY